MKIFWSWQSDTSQECGRYFVRDVLKYIAKQLNTVDTLEEAERSDGYSKVMVDFDTKDVAGSPHIASTILTKIQSSAVFVADVTPIGTSANGKKPIANPNVMIELGYAIKALGLERIVLVMNEAEGASLDSLPFDLRHLRAPVSYCLAANPDRSTTDEAFKKLTADLTARLKPSLAIAATEMRHDRRLSNPQPEFNVTLQAATGDLPQKISQDLSDLASPTIDSIKKKHPLLTPQLIEATQGQRSRVVAMNFGMGAPHIIRPPSQWTSEEVQKYNDRVENFYGRYERYLEDLAEHRRLLKRTLLVVLALENNGTAPGTDIDVFLDVPESMQLHKEDDLPEAPIAPEPPALDPDPPNYARLLPASEPRLRFGGRGKNWTDVSPEERRIRFHVDNLKHGFVSKSDAFHLSYTLSRDIGQISLPVEISAAALPNNLQTTITLNVALDESGM